MRIAMFSNTYKPTISGVVISLSMFREGLANKGHIVHIFAPETHNYRDTEPYIFRYPSLDLPERFDLDVSLILPFKVAMLPTIRGIKPHLIHSHHPYIMGGMASTFAQELDVPLVFTFHTRYVEHVKTYLPIISDIAGFMAEEFIVHYLNRCSHIIAPTNSTRNFILSEYDIQVPVSTVESPVDLSRYKQLDPARIRANWGLAGKEVLLSVGRLAPEKNLGFLLQVFAQLAAKRPKVHLMLVGQGPSQNKLQTQAHELGIAKQVTFTGAVPYTDVPHFAAAADLFVFPSLTETQGLVLTEAMAAGTPVVAVEAPGPVDVLAEGGGLLVPANQAAFASAITQLLDDEAYRHKMGETALRVVQRFSISAATANLVNVYQTTLDNYKPKLAR